MTIGRFIAGIGVLIWDPDSDKFLILKRSEKKDFGPGLWECVTGRVDQGEGFDEAAHREVKEELGSAVDLLDILGTTHFYRGDRRPDFELIGIVYLGQIPEPQEITISEEHTEYRWVTAVEARTLISPDSSSEEWLGKVLDRAQMNIAAIPSSHFERNRHSGFELDPQ